MPRHQAIWLEGAVPSRYWQDAQHRRRYLRWLGQRLGYRKPQDWYQITTDDFKRNRGGGVLTYYWNSSAIAAVKWYLPEEDWKEWLFGMCPIGFWRDRSNRRRYLQWLGQRLGFGCPEDWYQVTNRHFAQNKGAALLMCYQSTVSAAVMDLLPYDWKEWRFSRTPKGFWDAKKNRRRYLKWLGEQLGFTKPNDWYSVTGKDFYAHYGNQLFNHRYQGSTIALMKDCFPRRTWQEWRFYRVPVGFWEDPKNRKRYIQWLGSRLDIRKSEDWTRVRKRDITHHCGGALLLRYDSYRDLLKECVPGKTG